AAAAAPPDGRPTVALVLGGGAARGMSHIGLLKALEEAGVPIDMLVGTSMGSLVAGLYATGLSSDNLAYLATTVDLFRLFEPVMPPRGAFIQTERFERFLELLTGHAQFETLPIPFYSVLTHLESGREVVWHRGPLSTGILASMAIPSVFPPVEIDGELYVDGGVASLVPVRAARELGADVVIAVDVRGDAVADMDLSDPLAPLQVSLAHLLNANTDWQLELADVVVKPPVQVLSSMRYTDAARFIALGYEAAREALPSIREALLAKDPDFPFNPGAARRGIPEKKFAEQVNEALREAMRGLRVLQMTPEPALEIGSDVSRLRFGADVHVANLGDRWPVYGLAALYAAGREWIPAAGIGFGSCQGMCAGLLMRRGKDAARWHPVVIVEGLSDQVHYQLEWEPRSGPSAQTWRVTALLPPDDRALTGRRQFVIQVMKDPRGLYGHPRSIAWGHVSARFFFPSEPRDLLGILSGSTSWYAGAGLAGPLDGSEPLAAVAELGVLLNERLFGLYPLRTRAAVQYSTGGRWTIKVSMD
ncbi:MAG: patatin-like phospholipase family protein, partial [Firmicutes bacterium]|nr:patatin-like phospholipase family protein [Bacillota bacterium]